MSIFSMFKNRKRVLGINERNLVYIKGYNFKFGFKVADNKIYTKKILHKIGVPSPKLIASIKSHDELKVFDWSSLPSSFVIKPVAGLEGGGIEIFYNKDKEGYWIKADGSRYSIKDLNNLAKSILDGEYSIHNTQDQVLIEERVKLYKEFKYYTYKGAPDIRVLVFNKIPIMSYIRIPTQESDGKANLAKGALAAGIDMASGTTTTAVYGKSNGGRGKIIEYVPNTKLRLSGLKIPYWDKILKHSIETSKASKLGFCAIDFLIDKDLGPVVVEINARPGLSIQIANQDGLRWRLRKVRDIEFTSINKSIRLAKDLFGGIIQEEIEGISGKTLIAPIENVKYYLNNHSINLKSRIDIGTEISQLNKLNALELGISNEIFDEEERLKSDKELNDFKIENTNKIMRAKYPYFSEYIRVNSKSSIILKPRIWLEAEIADTKIETRFDLVDRSNLLFKAVVGRKSLSKFLIDPSKVVTGL